MTATFHIRSLEPRDDAAVASIIRTVMPEFGADGPGFAIHDAEAEAYARPGCAYFVVERDGEVIGGAVCPRIRAAGPPAGLLTVVALGHLLAELATEAEDAHASVPTAMTAPTTASTTPPQAHSASSMGRFAQEAGLIHCNGSGHDPMCSLSTLISTLPE